jgi:hypothetical protein
MMKINESSVTEKWIMFLLFYTKEYCFKFQDVSIQNADFGNEVYFGKKFSHEFRTCESPE